VPPRLQRSISGMSQYPQWLGHGLRLTAAGTQNAPEIRSFMIMRNL
jgi:hypothetical protein